MNPSPAVGHPDAPPARFAWFCARFARFPGILYSSILRGETGPGYNILEYFMRGKTGILYPGYIMTYDP